MIRGVLLAFIQLRSIRMLPDLLVLLAGLTTLALLLRRWWPRYAQSAGVRRLLSLGGLLFAGMLAAGFLLRFARVAILFTRYFPEALIRPVQGAVIGWALLSVPAAILFFGVRVVGRVWKRLAPKHQSARRQFLKTAPALAIATPAAALGYGVFIARDGLKLREQKIEIPGLPQDLDGVTIAQLTDIHRGDFVSRWQVERAVAMANEARPRLTLVTGDLITTGEDPLDECLDTLAKLRAEAGVFGCMGNHEVYARAEDYVEREAARRGIFFLREQSAPLRFGDATLNLAGVDYQRARQRYLVGAEELIKPGAFNVLLSHNPDVFPTAAQLGFPLTISGHTHGGQVRVEILRQDLNMARFFTPYVDGLYKKNQSAVFVSRGIGTIGIPARLGAPPEVALITLARV